MGHYEYYSQVLRNKNKIYRGFQDRIRDLECFSASLNRKNVTQIACGVFRVQSEPKEGSTQEKSFRSLVLADRYASGSRSICDSTLDVAGPRVQNMAAVDVTTGHPDTVPGAAPG